MIRGRLALRIFLAIFLTLASVAAGTVALTSWRLDAQREQAAAASRSAVQAAAIALAEGGRDGLAAWAKAQDADPGDRRPRFLVVDDWGEELLGRRIPPALQARLDGVSPTPLPQAPEVMELERLRIPTLTSDDGERFRLLPLPPRGRRLGPFDLPGLPASLLLMALGITALASLWLARSITRPVLDLQDATEALAAGRLDARAPVRTATRRDELGRLAGAFDAMAARIGAQLRSRERLLRDVSHEIRSPLARMRLATGLAAQGADPATQLARIDTEVERLDALVSGILDVSRLAPGAPPLTREPLELLPLIERSVADARFEAESLGRRIEWEPPGVGPGIAPLRILGDAHWVSAAIENVVRNALRHTAPGTAVGVRVAREDGGYALRVRDAGPGVPESELAQIFEPFHRVPGAATPGGTGLGLAIAARSMAAHGGRIEARNIAAGAGTAETPGTASGLEMRLWWPATDAAGDAGRGTAISPG
ncbi:MAG: sensor histidine kinase [Gammaproteobacteria bacterium]